MAGKSVESRWTLKDLFTPKIKEAASAVTQFVDKLALADVAGKKFANSESSAAAVALQHKAALKESQEALNGTMNSVKTLLPFLGIGIATGFGMAVKSAIDFQDQMSQVGTLLDGTTSQVNTRLGQLSNQVESISRESGASLPDLTGGLYQVISAFGDTADAAKQLEIADRAATAGNATVSDSVNLLSAVMKGYGDTSVAMEQKVSDLAMQTVRLGKTTYPELAASMSEVTSSANLMGVSTQELFATQATLAVSLGGASQVATDMASALKALMSPSTQMKKALADLGYGTGQALIKAKGFKGALQELVESTHGNTAALSKMFGRVEGMKLAIQLAGAASSSYDQNLKSMQNSIGATDRAYAAATNTIAHKWKVLIETITTRLIQGGTNSGLMNYLGNVLNVATKTINFIATHWKTIGPVIIGVAGAFTVYKVAITAAKLATLAFNAASNVGFLGLAKIIATILVVAILEVVTHWQMLKHGAIDAWNGIVKATQWAVNMGINYINVYLRTYKFVFDAIKFAGISIWDGIIKAAQAGVNSLLHLISPLSGLLKHIGINIPTSVNFSGAIVNASAPKWDTSFGFQHVNFSGAQNSTGPNLNQMRQSQLERERLQRDHIQALKDNTNAVTKNSGSTDANTTASNANTSASKSNTKALSNGASGNMSAEQIADTLMPRLERHLYGT